ncbi:hypothetical protein AgCh_023740 [Apium graveolens]
MYVVTSCVQKLILTRILYFDRFGSIFKTHILGCPCVMISSPAAAKLVLVTKSHLFKPTFPASKERMLGKQAIFFHQGPYHAKLRKLVLRAFMPDSVKNIIPDIESLATESLKSWDGGLINTFQEMKTYTFNVALLSIFGKDGINYSEDLKKCYYNLEKGYNSMPINLPGTLFHKAMKARQELAQIIANIISFRRETKQDYNDLLGSFMGDKEGLTDEQIADNMIGVIFAARDTTASALTWIVKYLAENPSVLQAVTVSCLNLDNIVFVVFSYDKSIISDGFKDLKVCALTGRARSNNED